MRNHGLALFERCYVVEKFAHFGDSQSISVERQVPAFSKAPIITKGVKAQQLPLHLQIGCLTSQ
jgi:hypothetical protein